MREALIEIGTRVVFTLIMAGLSILFAYIGRLLAKNQKMTHIAAAMDELERVTHNAVGDLQQTVVDGLKKASENGKLTAEDIEHLGKMLLDKVAAQMSLPTIETLHAAGVDVEAMVHSVAEAYIAKIKGEA